MSPDPDTIAWSASYFKDHAAHWRSLSGDMATASTELRACPPKDPGTWAWPDLARIKEELDDAQRFFADRFVSRAPDVMQDIARKLDQVLINYVTNEAEGEQSIIDEVIRRLEN